MSIHVLNRKIQNRDRLNKVNSSNGVGFSLGVSNGGRLKNKCGQSNKRVHIVQKSYRNYHKFLLRYMVEPRTNIKRMSNVSASEHTTNKSLYGKQDLACGLNGCDLSNKKNAAVQNCSSGCHKREIITKDIRVISAGEQIQRVKANRVKPGEKFPDMEVSGNTKCTTG